MDAIRQNPLFVASQTTYRLQSLSSRLSHAQQVAMTQMEVNSPSDAPGRWGAIHGLQSAIADHQVWQDNLDRAQGWSDTAESTLAAAGTTVQRAWERAIQLSSGSYTAEERASAAKEIATLRDELLGLANTKVGDRSLFAGDALQSTAFDSTGVYQGATATGQIKIGPDEQMAASLDGSSIFGGGVDVFAALSDLEGALAANDPTAVASTIGSLKGAHQQLVNARQDVGYQQAHISDVRTVSEGLSSVLQARFTDAVGADPVAAYTELVSLQSSYQAALQVVSASSGSRLFDFLR